MSDSQGKLIILNDLLFRKNVIISAGATDVEIDEVLNYNQKDLFEPLTRQINHFPMDDEPFVSAWEGYLTATQTEGVFQALKDALVQFSFPIREGISRTADYQAATRKGTGVEGIPGACGLTLQRPGALELLLHQTPAGRIPLLITGHREDFVALVRALSMKNEPAPVPDAMGACIVSGYNNWERIRAYQRQWEAAGRENSESDWATEFKRIIPHKELYQDRFIILSDGPYSAVPAGDLGLDGDEWKKMSLIIRREHECAHYFTRRIFSRMQNNLMDELAADYVGIVAALGYYRADWFMRFLGLENFPDCREEGRIFNYRGNPPLSERAFEILIIIIKRAVENLERVDQRYMEKIHSPEGQARMLIALTCLTLEELGSDQGEILLQQMLDKRSA